jgi:N-acetylglucosamine-6-sulfatase
MRIAIIICMVVVVISCKKSDGIHKQAGRPNVIFILTDDHRYDFMGFMGKVPGLKTPGLDRIAREGAHLKNAFVSTSLCSPSRASILSGQYTHHHQVVDNQSLIDDSVRFFPEYLQQQDYQTAFIGKWHMGHYHDKPRKGFDYWVSFKGQGVYYNPELNVNGKEITYTDSTYITDLLTDYALDFLRNRDKGKPFFLYLSHKAVHAEFIPATRHKGMYENIKVAYPPSMFPPGNIRGTNDTTTYNYKDLPQWVKDQRYSWHGVDYMYHGAIKFEEFYKRYLETLLAVDESVEKLLKYLDENGLMDNTVVIYMGDNGFSFGEHGLIDKRQAYEESWRVPLLAMGKGVKPGISINQMVQNIDVAPTILDLAGISKPINMDGTSFAPLLRGETAEWVDTIYYEYFWERPFPQTPTVYAVHTSQYKFIRYQGIWSINELYDLKADPDEMHNLIRSPQHQQVARNLDHALFRWLERTNGMSMPLRKDEGTRGDYKFKGTY